MYTKILVPLDGSELAEVVIPYVKWFMEVSDVNEIVFLRVVEPFRMAGGLEAQVLQEDKKLIEQDAGVLARKYLDKIAGQFKDSRIKKNRVVLVGNKISPGNPVIKPDAATIVIALTVTVDTIFILIYIDTLTDCIAN